MANTFDIDKELNPDSVAREIAAKFTSWKEARSEWEEETLRIRNNVYATTTATEAKALPFKNRTVIPKLTQIMENLVANYMVTMFPNNRWLAFDPMSIEGAMHAKRTAIESYIRTKADHQDIITTFKELLFDWVLTGNCFAKLTYVNESKTLPETGETVPGFVGPKLFRISPHDIVFNPMATSFRSAPKIVRYLKSLGELMRDAKTKPELGYTEELVKDIMRLRATYTGWGTVDSEKAQAYTADGFGSLNDYYNSDLVEILEFRGDFFDGENLLEDHVITVVDRRKVVRKEPIKSWSGTSYIYQAAWRKRPDNLYGMSPLANLRGMQFKLNKLENIRADFFDQIANPITVEVGNIEFDGELGAPGGRYIVEDGGNVFHLRPDATVLNADLQIDNTMRIMEELAGSPRESMGLRTPGEKTAEEVRLLRGSANNIYKQKVEDFERDMIVPVLNDMLEMARRFMDGSDLIRLQDETFGLSEFLSVTKEDITAIGKIKAMGSKHYEKKASLINSMQSLANSGMMQFIAPHMSGIKAAKLIEQAMELEEFDLVQEFVGIMEQVEAQSVAQAGQTQLDEEQAASDVSRIPDEEL